MSKPNRIEKRFASLKEANKKAFITYVTAGYPNPEAYAEILMGQAKSGVDLIEIGFPFSDPMADGPIIQAANVQALKEGMTLAKVLELVTLFRKEDNETPIVLMGYYNPIYSYGIMRFLDDAAKAGVDGFIIPDLPPEEDAEFRLPAKDRDINIIRLVTPTTDAKRLPTVLKDSSGFLYCVSIAGITGSVSADPIHLNTTVETLRKSTDLPIVIGFGVNTPDQARDMAKAADGVIVGSAIVKRITANLDEDYKPRDGLTADVLGFVATLAKATHSA
ncbi:MAG: tryptophan synthase subunit alpha [Alphaproteobacteria bacterium]|nr:tryptophan synthase subunit alpha [Alphaproteobacteria bacterium]